MKHNFAGDYLTGLIPFGIWQSVKLIGTQKSVIENYRCEYDIHNNLATAHFDINIRNLQQEELNGETSNSNWQIRILHTPVNNLFVCLPVILRSPAPLI